MGVPIGDTVRARSDSAAESMTKLIRWLGDKCARRPCVVTFVMVFVSLLGASGLHVAEFETDGYKLWVPTESFAYKRWTETAELFGQGGRGGTLLFTADDMLSVPALTDVLTAHHAITSRDGLDEVDPNSGETTGEKVFFEDVCATFGPDDEYCDFWNPMAAFNYNQTVLDQVAAAGLVLPYIDALKTIMPLEAVLGDVQYDPATGIIASAAAMLVSWRLDPSRAKTQDPALAFEDAVLQYCDGDGKKLLKNVRLHCFMQRSVDDEVVRLTATDAPLFGIALVFITAYLVSSLSSCDSVKARGLLGASVIVMCVLAVLVGFGMCVYCGLKVNSISIMVPFLVLGVGCDDIFVVLEFWDRELEANPIQGDDLSANEIEDYTSKTLGNALLGASSAIFLTSFTACIAFITGLATDMPAINTFCLISFWAFLWNFVLSVTFFPALLALDFRRSCAKRHGCCPCISAPYFCCCCTCKVGAKNAVQSAETGDVSRTMKFDNNDPVGAVSFGSNECVDSMTDDGFATIIENAVLPVLLNPFGRVAVAVITVLFGALTLANLRSIGVGLSPSEVVPDDSYVIEYLDEYSRYWKGTIILPIDVVLKDVDYSDPAQLQQCCYNATSLKSPPESLFYWLENDADSHVFGTIGSPTSTWLKNHIASLQALGLDISDSPTFYDMITQTVGPTAAKYKLSCGGKNFAAGGSCERGVKAARYKLWSHMPQVTLDAHDLDVNLNSAEFSKRLPPGTDGYAFSLYFMYGDLDAGIFAMIVETLLWAIGAIFVTLLAAQGWRTALVGGITMLSIDLDLIGVMLIWDIKLNPPAFVCLVMAVGLAVDYCVHIAHGFEMAKGSNDHRTISAMRMMGAPVLKGGFTTFLGTLVLSFTSSLIFRTFFKLLFSTVVLGVLHGLYFAPVALRALALIPPLPWEREYVPTSVEPPELAPAYEKGSRTDS